tara:strand:+ start:90 stop:407 length:318 start_codon:yes stop_codon:yes gene_type:complete
MKIDKTNIQAIHNVLHTDLQRRMFRQYNARTNEFNITDEDYDNAMSQLHTDVYNCNSINDINDLLVNSTDLFDGYDDIIKFTLDGTLNYILTLLIKHAELNKCKC